MKVEDLDEFQGVTPQMVRTAAEARGFIYRDTVLHYPDGKVALFLATNPHFQGHAVALIAGHLKLSLQFLLREINPRLRKGWPSAAARAAHRGEWLVGIDDGGPGLIMQPLFEDSTFCSVPRLGYCCMESYGNKALFWPCDSAANKVRWPELNGVML